MLVKIEEKEVRTIKQIKEKYPTNFFIVSITEIVDKIDQDMGYVLYIGDTVEDLLEVDRDELKDKHVGFLHGGGINPEISIENFECEERQS